MNHARLFYNDTPEFIPVPSELIHRKTEVIFLSLDEEEQTPSTQQQRPIGLAKDKGILLPDAFFEPLADDFLASFNVDTENPPELTELFGKVPPCFKSAEEIDAFIRSERDAWDD